GADAGSASARAEGILPATQWPGYDVAHWTVAPNGCGAADRSKCSPGQAADPVVTDAKASDWTGQCTPGRTFPIRRFVQYATNQDVALKLDANEIVLTFPDQNTAAGFLSDARNPGSPKSCSDDPRAETTVPGVSTADGVSWVSTSHTAAGGYLHGYVVRAGDRVAVLRVNQMVGDTMQSTAKDELVLADMEQALAK
ncbi:hypothetical protein KGQ20_29045, partial [Catenulispora sp. NF23]